MLQAVGWLVAIPFITTRLTADEQGFYYTFASLTALQVFVELGMTGVIVQSLAHEVAHLKLEKLHKTISWTGSAKNRSRLASVLQFTTRWFFVAGILCGLVLAAAGYYFLSNVEVKHGIPVQWAGPWLALSCAAMGSVWMSGVLSVMEGFGRMACATMIRMISTVLSLLALILGLWLGAGLWAVGLQVGVVVIVALGSSIFYLRDLWKATVKEPLDHNYRWRLEIWPVQWRIALSWISGWFIFQAMTPMILHVNGSEAAGRFGLALQLATGVQALSGVWIQIRVPFWGMMISRKEWLDLDRDFFWVSIMALATAGTTSLVVVVLLSVTASFGLPSERLPSISTLYPLLVVAILNQWIFSMAAYLRAHRREPFLFLSVAIAVVMIVIFSMPQIANEACLPLAYCAVTLLFGVIFGSYVWANCREKWHRTLSSGLG